MIAYSAERIELTVDESCFGARTLLVKEGQQKVEERLRKLFAFQGQFVISKLEKKSHTASIFTRQEERVA